MIDGRFYFRRDLGNGRTIDVVPLLFGRARLHIGVTGSYLYDDGWWYDNPTDAVAAAQNWDGEGEPTGWMRHPRTGRRRPGGDPTQEYVNL